MTKNLSDLLHDSVDDHEIVVPDLLVRARAARTRRRVGVAVVAAAVLVPVGVLALNGPTIGRARVAAPASATPTPTVSGSHPPTTQEPTAQGLSLETVGQRCGPQLAAYDGDPRWAVPAGIDPQWRVAHTDQSYEVGDVVLFVSPGLNDRICILGATGEEPTGIPDPAPSLADPQRLLALCSQEMRRIDGSEVFFDTPDLRAADIVNAAEKDGYVTALLKLADAYYTCDVSARDASGLAQQVTPVTPPAPGDEFWGIASSYFVPGGAKTTSDTPYDVGSGFVPVAGATRMVVDGDFTVDIVDGTYSFVVTRTPKTSGRTVVDYLDAAGTVLFTSDDEGGAAYRVP